MSHLPDSVHPRIGASGSVGQGFNAAKTLERGADCRLNRGAVFLYLPANIGSAIIFDGQFVAIMVHEDDPACSIILRMGLKERRWCGVMPYSVKAC